MMRHLHWGVLDIKCQVHISYIRYILAWLCDIILVFFFPFVVFIISKYSLAKVSPQYLRKNLHLLSSHLIGTMLWDVVVISSCKHILVLLYILAIDYGKKRQEQTPVFVICYSTSIVTFPWERTKKTRMKN